LEQVLRDSNNHAVLVRADVDNVWFKHFIARALGLSTGSVQAAVIGRHGGSIVRLRRFSAVNTTAMLYMINLRGCVL
jgi:malate/lactate dehydrogenase